MADPLQDGPLAEFSALRSEILQRMGAVSATLTFQLTLVGAILSIAIGRSSLQGIILVIPFVSYLLYMRYIDDTMAIAKLARYIEKELSPKVSGGLEWERLAKMNVRLAPPTYGRISRFLSFPVAGAIGLVWAFDFVFVTKVTSPERVALVALWVVGALGTAHLLVEITRGRLSRMGRIESE